MTQLNALKTDLYQASMIIAYIAEGREQQMSTFELSTRNLPPNRNYLLYAGVDEAINYMLNIRFTKEDIEYIKLFPQFKNLDESIFKKLESFRFTGDVWTMKEGTAVFQNTPPMFINSSLLHDQFFETYLLGLIRSHTRFASKASRVVEAAAAIPVYEFGSRHIHPLLAPICARDAYIAGCAGTSNVYAGMQFGIPVSDIRGTMAHSYVLSSPSELEAFRNWAKIYPDSTLVLADTFAAAVGMEEGIKNAIIVAKELADLGHKMVGIRIDSEPFVEYSRIARKLLSEAVLPYVKIFISGDMDEYKIPKLIEQGAQIDALGVGKAIATSDDAPHIDASYKLCEIEREGEMQPIIKISTGKTTNPSLKQVYRHYDSKGEPLFDEICLSTEKRKGNVEPLLQKVVENGEQIADLPSLQEIRSYVRDQKRMLPPRLLGTEQTGYNVVYSEQLQSKQKTIIAEKMRR